MSVRSVRKKEDYIEEARHTRVRWSCEVLVVGSGPAGLSAAIAAARAGADVILVERSSCFGGVITNVGMETIGWYRYEGTVDGEGIGKEFEREAKSLGASSFPYNESQCLEAERFKLVADRLILDARVRPLLHTWVVDVMKEQDKVCGVIVESKSGREAIRATMTIDATGDADLVHMAGGAVYCCSPREGHGSHERAERPGRRH